MSVRIHESGQARRNQELTAGPLGFSLIELLIVVSIILIIAAIAIPNLLKSRMAANQSAAVASLRTTLTAEYTYAATYDTGFSSDLPSLGPPASGNSTSSAAGLLDSLLAGGTKSGYSFTYSAAAPDRSGYIPAFTVTAAPNARGVTGTNYYFTDQSGVIRQNSTGPTASRSDSPIGG